MALTPDQIQAMNQITGLNKPVTQTQATGQSRANEIRALVKPESNPSGGEGLVQDLSKDVAPRMGTVVQNTKDVFTGKKNLGEGVVQNLGEIAAGTADTGIDILKSIFKPEIRQGVADTVGGAMQSAVNSKDPTISAAIDNPVITGLRNAWENLKNQHPESAKDLEAAFNIASVLPGPKAASVAADATKQGLKSATDMASKIAAPLVEGAQNIKDAIPTTLKDAVNTVREPIQKNVAKGNIPGVEGLGQQAKTSAERLVPDAPLIGAGAARQAKPVDVYNDFANQETKHLSDIKQDPAISLVGQRIGDAFSGVVKQRQQAGKTMASELEKTGTKAVSTKNAFSKFQKELIDNGVAFDSIERKIVPGSASKFSDADNSIMERYATDLQKLGSSPTMKQLDAFVSRMPKEIEGLKATRGIQFNTNAERIIKNNLSELRDTLTKSGTAKYATARQKYSDLSNFIDEGASHLGKLTQSGDFAKDASLAKSAVQSVLNNGKKDWLIKLEGLTGYKALDEATLALQAMKDAGDFKGNSLLELLTDGSGVATTPHGMAAKLIGFMGKTAGKALIGSKADQTRAFLKSLESNR